ncbi:hypothetical protein C0J52_19058 [Blattella germanica]|nr:hypothetical protein C0J52_19058 [Blattella germanica]
MAEFVNLRTEDMIPELEKMEQFRLFEKDEIRAIAKKRKDYEYKIQRRTKCKEDYLRYIQYEMDILKLIKIRREKMGPLDKKNDVEYLVAKRIHKLFKATLQKFKDDARIYISYFKFCKQVAFKLELEYAAIKWAQSKAKSETEVEKQASVPGNCTSASSGKDKQQNEEMTDKVLDGELAYMIFESAMKKIQDTRLVSDLMATAMQYQFTSKLQHKLMAYVEILKSEGKEKKLTGILRTATKRYPSSAELWNIRLQLHLSKDEEKMALQVFREATARLGSSNKAALPLWKMMLQYYHTKDMNKVEQIFQEGIIQGPQISVALKPMYIEWVVLVKGIQVARKLYEKLSIQPPLCLELHSKMASLECMQPEMNIKQVRRCFEVACQQNGHNVTDVWMDYIRFERTLGNPEKESQIYIRGTRALDPTLLDSFENEYSLMKTEST